MDQIVSKELASRAREIGFDEWCERSYMKIENESLSNSWNLDLKSRYSLMFAGHPL